jgi:lipoprotein-anchoring transpeptidase ErfK/SrfK
VPVRRRPRPRLLALVAAVGLLGSGCTAAHASPPGEGTQPTPTPVPQARATVPTPQETVPAHHETVPLALPSPPTTEEILALKTDPQALLPARSGQGRRVVYDRSEQRVWLVERGETVARTYLVSGQRTQPGPGRYRVYSRSRHTRSAVSDETMRLMVRFAHGRRTGAPIGFHTIPRHADGTPAQTEAQRGRPLSAGCVRQRDADARALWRFGPVGTPVVVLR